MIYTIYYMMTSNGKIFRVTRLLLGESIGHRWIPLIKASNAELLCGLWCAPEQMTEQTIEMPVIWDAMTLITSLYWLQVPASGSRLNIKTVLSTYGDFHVKDKTAVRTSYL